MYLTYISNKCLGDKSKLEYGGKDVVMQGVKQGGQWDLWSRSSHVLG